MSERPPFLSDPTVTWVSPDDGSVDMTTITMNGSSQVIGNPRRSLYRRDGADEDDVLAPPIQPLPEVDMSHFEPYLAKVGGLLRQWRANHAGVVVEAAEAAASEEVMIKAEMARVLDIVPSMFFSADFRLVDRAIFAIMSDSAVQSKLPIFLEYVELCLLKQISSRSEHFFAALQELQELASYVHTKRKYVAFFWWYSYLCVTELSTYFVSLSRYIASSTAKVCEIRRYVATLQKDVVASAMSVPAKSRARANAAMLKALVVKIEALRRAPQKAGALYAENRPLEAVRVLTAARRTHRTELRKVKMLKGLGAKLDKLETAMADRMFRNFRRCSTRLQYMSAKTKKSTGGGGSGTSGSSSLGHVPNAAEYSELIASVHATAVLGKTKELIASYLEHISKAIKVRLRTVVAEVVNPSARGSGSGAGEKVLAVGPYLKKLGAAEFLSVIQLVQEHLARLLIRAGLVHDAVRLSYFITLT